MRYLVSAILCLMMGVSLYAQSPCNNQTSVTYQGYDYDIVEIGDQCWFAENCRYIPFVSNSNTTSSESPNYFVYDYEGNNLSEAIAHINFNTYGVLYNWPAVVDETICPNGWHVPSDQDWMLLESFVGITEEELMSLGFRGENQACDLKSEWSWDYNENEAICDFYNSTDFYGLAAGMKVSYDNYSVFSHINHTGYWWSTTINNISKNVANSYMRHLTFWTNQIFRGAWASNYALSARCVTTEFTSIVEQNTETKNKQLISIIDFLGREVNHTTNQLLFHIYDDGSVEKKFVVE